jgi:hypothetical protein
MDVTSGLKSEILRPITTVLVPGALAVGPYVAVAGYYAPAVRTFWNDHPTAFSTIAVFCILAAGLVLEDLGSLIESKLWDPILKRRDSRWKSTWDAYRQLSLKDDAIGQRYLDTILGRLKFELSMGPSLVFLTIGVGWMNSLWQFWPCSGYASFAAFTLTLAGYLLWESFNSTLVLAETRSLLVEAATRRGSRGQDTDGA